MNVGDVTVLISALVTVLGGYGGFSSVNAQPPFPGYERPRNQQESDGISFKSCRTPPKPPGVGARAIRANQLLSFNTSSHWPDTVLTFYCEDGEFSLFPEHATMRCMENGEWNPRKTPVCYKAADKYKDCEKPSIKNGAWKCMKQGRCDMLTAGTLIKVSCAGGYELSGTALVKCLSSGRWSPSLPSCRLPSCRPLSPVGNGTFRCITENCLSYSARSVVDVRCDQGYVLIGNERLSCRENGQWSSPEPQCLRLPSKPCVPFKIQHGQWEVGVGAGYTGYQPKWSFFGAGDSITYHCNVGYRLVGSTRLTCDKEGRWSDYPPKCDPKILCPDVGPMQNGRFECAELTEPCREFSVGVKLVFVCDDGYQQMGSREMTCTGNGRWSASKPSCRKVSSTTAPATSGPLRSTTTVVIVTACSVLGVLLMILMLVVAIHRRRPPRPLIHQVDTAPPPPYSQYYTPPTPVPSDLEPNLDRLALIAYDGVTLPSYDEAVLTHSRRSRQLRHPSDAGSRHSVLTNSTVNRETISAFGSLDTVHMSSANLSTVASTDNTSTSVTVDTYDSGASVPSIAMTSRRAVAGSFASTSDTSSLHKEESPLLEHTPDSPSPPTQDVALEEIKDE